MPYWYIAAIRTCLQNGAMLEVSVYEHPYLPEKCYTRSPITRYQVYAHPQLALTYLSYSLLSHTSPLTHCHLVGLPSTVLISALLDILGLDVPGCSFSHTHILTHATYSHPHTHTHPHSCHIHVHVLTPPTYPHTHTHTPSHPHSLNQRV